MCRSIKRLRRPGEAAAPEEYMAAALQFVRKISGFHHPSQANRAAFEDAVRAVAAASQQLLESIGASRPAPGKPPGQLSSTKGMMAGTPLELRMSSK